MVWMPKNFIAWCDVKIEPKIKNQKSWEILETSLVGSWKHWAVTTPNTQAIGVITRFICNSPAHPYSRAKETEKSIGSFSRAFLDSPWILPTHEETGGTILFANKRSNEFGTREAGWLGCKSPYVRNSIKFRRHLPGEGRPSSFIFLFSNSTSSSSMICLSLETSSLSSFFFSPERNPSRPLLLQFKNVSYCFYGIKLTIISLPTHWVTVTQAEFQIPVTYTIVLSVFFLSIKFFLLYLWYFNKHYYISEIFSIWLKKSSNWLYRVVRG